MDAAAPRFYPADPAVPAAAGALARYLPPLPPGMAAGWLAEHVPAGSWLFDPLGASPALALEAARAGYRVLVASNNPIISFIIETLAHAPKTAAFQSVLAELANARRGGERIEGHIQALYTTECDTCGAQVPAQAFLWRKGEAQPFARQFRCPHCGDNSPVQRDITAADLERLIAMGGDRLQRARALQRVILNEEEHRADVEEALEHYLPRPLYALFTLANKAEGLGLPPERLRLLQALLLSVFDAGSTLWGWPARNARPKQLVTPPQFRENNLWLALEAAVGDWAQPALTPVTVTRWPDLPPGESGICLYRGRVRALMPLPETLRPSAVLTVFPRPNQAFWTLSVLWAGWLWGAEAALPLRNVLDRRRYDWNWHTSAVHNALAAVRPGLDARAPFFGMLPELAPGFLSAVVLAAEAAGFHLAGLSQRVDGLSRADAEIAQGLWFPTAENSAPPAKNLESIARDGIRADLTARNEPAAYLTVYAAGLSAMAASGALARLAGSPASGGSGISAAIPGDLLTRVQAALARTLADRSFLRLYGAKPERPEGDDDRGAWWLQGTLSAAPITMESGADPSGLPLGDRIEMEVVRFMQKRMAPASQAPASTAPASPAFTAEALDSALRALFPGLLSPPAELVRACLESYGEPLAPVTAPAAGPSGALWRMRASESAAARKADLGEMRMVIEAVGRRLGFETSEKSGLLAWEQHGEQQWWFFRMASSILSRYVLAVSPSSMAPPPRPLERCVLVLPGSRAPLLAAKLRRDPRMAEAAAGWRMLKFRQLRVIASEPTLTLATWQAMLDDDPLTDEATQMALFPY